MGVRSGLVGCLRRRAPSCKNPYRTPLASKAPLPKQSATDALRAALSEFRPNAYTIEPSMLAPLRPKVCAVVDELKAAGAAPEHVLLAVKGIAFGAMKGPYTTLVVDRMVKWCLEQYFKESPAA